MIDIFTKYAIWKIRIRITAVIDISISTEISENIRWQRRLSYSVWFKA